MNYITPSQLARMVNLSVDAVRYRIRRGKVTPAARTDSGGALFTREQAERLAAECKRSRETRGIAPWLS